MKVNSVCLFRSSAAAVRLYRYVGFAVAPLFLSHERFA
jgi:hypothetical protein